MSRSYRRPYSAPCGNGSAKQDKMLASRGVRRAQNRAVREAIDWEEFELPHRFECNHNDVWSWGRDGKQRLQTLSHNDFNPCYCTTSSSYWTKENIFKWNAEHLEWKLKWLRELQRK